MAHKMQQDIQLTLIQVPCFSLCCSVCWACASKYPWYFGEGIAICWDFHIPHL